MGDALKPCPFCGGGAVYAFRHNSNESGWQNDVDHWIYCDSEDCLVHVGMGETKQEVVGQWNTRTDTPREKDTPKEAQRNE